MKKVLVSIFSLLAVFFCSIGFVGCGGNADTIVGSWQFYSQTVIDSSGAVGGSDYIKVGDKFKGYPSDVEAPTVTAQYMTLEIHSDGSLIYVTKNPSGNTQVYEGTWEENKSNYNFAIDLQNGEKDYYTASIVDGQLVIRMTLTDTDYQSETISVTYILNFDKV